MFADVMQLGVPLVLLIVTLILFVVVASFFQLWLLALLSGAYVPLASLISMRLRRVSPGVIVRNRIVALKAGLNLNISDLEEHYLKGGNVAEVVQALVAAKHANLPLSFEQSAAMDLAGHKVVNA